MAKRSIEGSRGIVTGASSGIGRAIARELSKHGARVLAVARRAELLNQLAADARGDKCASPIELLAGDICDASLREHAVIEANRLFGGLDFLVNAAGVSSVNRFVDSSPDRLREIMKVNFFAPAELIRAALPLLQKGTKPIVVNVGSILGHRGIPWHSDYCASKFALQGLSESIRPELAKVGIDLLVVSPGTTKTELYSNDPSQQNLPWPQPHGVSPEYVARKTIRAMARGLHEIIPNSRGRLLVFLSRMSPYWLDRLMARYG
jgi:short-subunit dehydrogenase